MDREDYIFLHEICEEYLQQKEEIDKLLLNAQDDMLSQKREKLLLDIERFEKILSEEAGQGISALNLQEADRQRIARDLHDISLQKLAHMVHKIELSSLYIDKDPIRAKLELSVVNKRLREVIDEIRGIIYNIRPMTFDDLGIKAAFERLINVINENKSFEIDMDIEDVSCENDIVLVTIYRVVQECMTNIRKHAQATQIYFCGKMVGDNYNIVIRDNGKGFNRDEVDQREGKHFGLLTMKERIYLVSGNIDIHSDNNGTEINISIPIRSKI